MSRMRVTGLVVVLQSLACLCQGAKQDYFTDYHLVMLPEAPKQVYKYNTEHAADIIQVFHVCICFLLCIHDCGLSIISTRPIIFWIVMQRYPIIAECSILTLYTCMYFQFLGCSGVTKPC